ncbi:MAG TPA: sulfotransferase [Acidimicrobiia bacterium]|nr:sulfotransferase [Acidimicrobiia bacterium]
MTVVDLTADRAVEQATEETGLGDLGEGSWKEGLERLVDALKTEAALNELGAALVGGELVGYLGDRMRVLEWRKQHPEIVGVDVVPPIVIVGQGRTGTTILHELLAMDPASRVPLTWEIDHPVPPPETATYDTDPRIAQVDETLAGVDLVLPGFMQMHPMGAQLPQECVRITSSDFRSMIFPTQYSVPSYADWLLHEADMAPAYRWHRMFLEHLQSKHPAARWVLKSPGHLWALDALVAEYPNALLVQTHRDPLRILASLSSLVARLRSLASDDSTIPRAAADFADNILDGLDRSVDAREDGTVPADQVVDVQFRSFMADPFATIHSIYEKLGLELAPEAEQRMRAFFAANPSDKHGTHTYTFADTGLDEGTWRERARRYQEYFDVPSEPLG